MKFCSECGTKLEKNICVKCLICYNIDNITTTIDEDIIQAKINYEKYKKIYNELLLNCNHNWMKDGERRGYKNESYIDDYGSYRTGQYQHTFISYTCIRCGKRKEE